MKKEIVVVDKERGIYRVTTVDERFYARPALNAVTGLPDYEYLPSVTWITDSFPRGIAWARWLANLGWNEAEAARQTAGDKGSKVHNACADLIDGKTLAMDSVYMNPSTGQMEPLTHEEWECLMAFRDFWATARPTTLLRDATVFGENYAGTLDWLGTLEDPPGLFLLDLKSGQHVWPSHILQVSAYKHGLLLDPPADLTGPFMPGGLPFVRLGILQLGYRANQRRWKFTEVEDKYDLFQATHAIWAHEHGAEKPLQRDYPLELTLAHGPVPEPVSKIKQSRKKSDAVRQEVLA